MMVVKELMDEDAKTQIYTVSEFERVLDLPQSNDLRLELINGKINEKMPTLQHGFIAARIAAKLNDFASEPSLGWAVVEAHHQIPGDTLNAFLPDVSYMTAARPFIEEGIAPFMPDLAVEIKSPNDTIKGMREKAGLYLARGTSLVWLIYPHHRMVEVYPAEGDVQILFGLDVLTGGDLLPGFSIPVTDIFALPAAKLKDKGKKDG